MAGSDGSTSRARMIASTAKLVARQGLAGTGFARVIQESGAPRGSIYHHFPGGKAELAEEAVRFVGQRTEATIRSLPAESAADTMADFVDLWRSVVLRGDGSGCAVAGSVLDVDSADERSAALLDVAHDIFSSWSAALAERFASAGLSEEAAAALATSALASMEGALILSRAAGGPGPLEVVGDQLAVLARAAS
ncbi:TetR/AcrR family transcriptional regulator [Leifsonia sp. AG29]|uniref:TetR/AcrR family transcriptional regulator n=1 Tax=Leifsonia sp. AG29 TaxID=2598860 RepID=UPI00131C1FDE|nr:TetR/AcrR family transcriptional regulator [Leifsonia sp. AG29]